MQVNLDDSTNITVDKADGKEEFTLKVDGRTTLTFSRSELKFIQAMIDAVLKEDEGMSRESLQKSLKDAVDSHKAQLQLTLRNMKAQDIAYAVWYVGDDTFTLQVLANMSKRSAEDVQTAVKETIERRIRKERAEGNKDIEDVMKEQGRSAASALLRKVLDS